MKPFQILILVIGMATMWYIGYRAGLLECQSTRLVNENVPQSTPRVYVK